MDLIEDFMDATSNMASPKRFRLWSAISMVSSTLTRRVWTCIEDDLKLFANTYIILVSIPGIGKTRPMDLVELILEPLSWVTKSPDEVTRQRTVQDIADVFPESANEGDASFFFLVAEMASFLPEADAAWMQAMARLWDCPRHYHKAIKTPPSKGKRTDDKISNAYVNLLFGAQPSWFAEGFPKASYEMGLPARVFFIFAEGKPTRKLFRRRKQMPASLRGEFRADLKRLRGRWGEVRWEPDAEEAFIAWMDNGQEPVVDDPLLRGYNTRRDMHAGKLALIVACSRGHKTITLEDLERAWEYLFEAEVDMPVALTNAGGNMYRMQEETIIQFVSAEYERTHKYVHERLVRRRLGQMVNSLIVERIVNELIASGRLKIMHPKMNHGPDRLLKPGTK